MSKMVNIGNIAIRNSALFICDIQEKFRSTISHYPAIISNSKKLLKAAEILNIPVVVTEQYPKGLGNTVAELDVSKHNVFAKKNFSMVIPEVEKHLDVLTDVKSVMLCGIEAHVCVQQTAMDLIERGFDVHLVADAVSSRNNTDRMFAIERLRSIGAHVTTVESMLLQLVKGATHPNFKQIQALIMESGIDSGLLAQSV